MSVTLEEQLRQQANEQQIRKDVADFRQKLAARTNSIKSCIRDREHEGIRFPEPPCPPEVQAERDFIEAVTPKLDALKISEPPPSNILLTLKKDHVENIGTQLAALKAEYETLLIEEFKKIYMNSRKGLSSTIEGYCFFNHPWSEMNKMLKSKDITMENIYQYARKYPDSRTHALLVRSPTFQAGFNDFCAKQLISTEEPTATCRW